MKIINVPKVTMMPDGAKQFATEVAYNALVAEARALNIAVAPCMGLMYLPTQAVTEQFKEACAAVLKDLSS